MNTKVLKYIPLIVICLAVISIVGTPVFITLRNRESSAKDTCQKTDKAFREYAVTQNIDLSYRPLAAAIDNQANTMIVAGRSPSISFFSLTDEDQRPALSTNFSEFHSLALNEEKGYLIGGTSDGATLVWEKSNTSETGWNETAVTLPGKHRGHVSAVAISAGGELIGASGNDTIFVWQKDQTSQEWVLKSQLFSAHSGLEVRDIAFGARDFLFSVGNDSRVKVWEADGDINTALFSYITADAVDSITVNVETEAASVGLRNGSVEVWEADAQQKSEPAIALAGDSHLEPVKSLAISMSDNLLVSGSNDKTVKVWSTCTGEIFQTFLDHSDWVNSVDISAEGNTIVSTGIDDRVIIRSRQSE